MSNAEAMAGIMGGGGVSAAFTEIGATVKGAVLSMERRQDADMDGAPKTWPNGDPMWVYLIRVQTDARDSEEDDGERTIWCRGDMIRAVREAFRAAGLRTESSPIGGTLAVQYHKSEPAKKRGHNARKIYRARFEAAKQTVGQTFGDDPGADPADPALGADEIPF